MQNNRLCKATCLFVVCVGLAGCKSLRDEGDLGLIAPISESLVPNHLLSASDVSERDLCLEAAKTVADQGHAAEAIKLYEKAESLAPSKAKLDLELAPLYAQIGNVESAVQRYQNVIQSGDATANDFNNLAWTFIQSGRHNDAIQTIQQGIAGTPDDQRLHSSLAVALYKQGDREKALSKFTELYGQSAGHHNLAILDLENGDHTSALQQATLAAQYPDCQQASIELRDTIQTQLQKAN